MVLNVDIIKACKMTALSCRKCISNISVVDPLQSVYKRSFKQCEDICFAFLQAARSNSLYLQKFTILCIGLCDECAELADEKKDEEFMEAAMHCRQFSNMLINFIPVDNNYISH